MNYFNIEYLSNSENETWQNTISEMPGVTENIPKIINCCCKLPYFRGNIEDPNTSSFGSYQSIAYIHFGQASYTLWCIYNLFIRGEYLESFILMRHLLEVFIQLKYFFKYPEKMNLHILATRRKDRISFKDMFDEFSPGYYHEYYSKQYSEMTHGVLFKLFYRFDIKNEKIYSQQIGSNYNEQKATYVFHSLVPIIFGLLKIFPYIFKNNTLTSDNSIKNEYDYSINWLKSSMLSHEKNFPDSQEYYNIIKPIFIDFSNI